MKKALTLLTAFLLVMCLLLTGCEQSLPEETSTPAPAPADDGGDAPADADVPVSDEDAPAQSAAGSHQFVPMKIRFFVGGEAGDAFASIVYKGAMDAAEMLKPYNVEVDYVFSGWEPEKMVSQLREAVASDVDAICMMGHPGDDAIMPLAEEAKEAGIIMMYQNVNVPEVRKQYGGGFTGLVDLSEQGIALAQSAINELGLQPGDRAVVFGSWGQPGRYFREEGTAVTFEEYGMTVERVVSPPEAAADPQLLLPLVSGQLQSAPDTKVIVYPGGQQLSAAGTYMEACGVEPGDVYNIGFDLSDGVLEGFREGYVQLTADQQPYLQGFMPVMNAFLTKNFQLSGLQVETGAGLVDESNFENVKDLVEAGYR